ncbi:hypothetical protein ABEB36_005024 [Hypothenemus hampei]|uniref:Uncharacterized protein n=1 Tax=Hypothenemus hampei TaxID=57062 RepID=A0ABD1EX97_HYPHA
MIIKIVRHDKKRSLNKQYKYRVLVPNLIQLISEANIFIEKKTIRTVKKRTSISFIAVIYPYHLHRVGIYPNLPSFVSARVDDGQSRIRGREKSESNLRPFQSNLRRRRYNESGKEEMRHCRVLNGR